MVNWKSKQDALPNFQSLSLWKKIPISIVCQKLIITNPMDGFQLWMNGGFGQLVNVSKQTPSPSISFLLPEEALYLHYQLNRIQLPRKYPENSKHYAVYSYLRRKGWIVRSGLKYGCHYGKNDAIHWLVLYEKHPLTCHSMYGVYIVQDSIDYIQIQALSRLLEKKLMLCMIHPTIEFTLFERFIPSQSR